jgi:hypothetical protein
METDDFELPLSAATAMVGFARPWCIAGGWALDLWLGRQTRQHRRIKFAVLRDHQIELRDYCHGWRFQIVTLDNRLVAWKESNRQMLMLPVHTLCATDRAGRSFDIHLHESDGIDWIDRHDFGVRLNLSRWIIRSHQGVPVLCPQIVLLLKSHAPTEQDELDFRSALEHLLEPQRTWLKLSLMRINPHHAWLETL